MIHNEEDWGQYPVTVCHIDDQRSVTSAMEKMLEDVNYLNIHTCNKPENAIEAILKIGPTVILLDMHMPVTSGQDILQQLQHHDATKDIPALILTMDTSSKTKQNAFHMGANDYLIKTPDKNELVLRLRYHTRSYIDHLEREATYKALLESKQKLKESIEELERSSYLDSLTGISNRRSFDKYFEVEWQRALRETTPLSLIFIDVDFFKQYNDFYGHLAGDDCLKEIASSLQKSLQRPTDLVSRYGGEEFVVVLPSTHGQGAMLIAERLRKNIEALNLDHAESKGFDIVTVSLGTVTTSPMVKHHSRDFIHMADTALYEAKQNGRNQVICKTI
ncbi:MAG: diguanylate cyclase [Ghiorsea sp.]